jgi:hypothetical protein
LSKNLLIFKEIISVTGFFPILNESRFNWFSEILSIIRELKISYNDVMSMSISDRRSFIFLYNKHMAEIENKSENDKANLEPPN